MRYDRGHSGFPDPLPEGVELPGPVRLCAEADLLPDGSFGRQWLIVAGEGVMVFQGDGKALNRRCRSSRTRRRSPWLEVGS